MAVIGVRAPAPGSLRALRSGLLHKALYRRTKRKTSDHFGLWGCRGFLVCVAAPGCFARRGQSLFRLGSGVSIAVVTTERRRTTSSPVIGVFRIRPACSARPLALVEQRRAVTARVANGWPGVLRRCGLFGTSVLVSTTRRHVGIIGHRRSVTAAPLCGLFDTSGTRGRSVGCGLIRAAV